MKRLLTTNEIHYFSAPPLWHKQYKLEHYSMNQVVNMTPPFNIGMDGYNTTTHEHAMRHTLVKSLSTKNNQATIDTLYTSILKYYFHTSNKT